MKVYDMEQKSEAWFQIKNKRIGGSSAHTLTTTAKFKTAKMDLISQHLEPFIYDEDDANRKLSKDVERGNEYEPLAREYLCDYTGLEFHEHGWLQSDIDVLGLSPDGCSAGFSQSAEFKCPSRAVHTSYIFGGEKIPTVYFWQNISYFAVIPQLQNHYFMSYRPECSIPAHIITLERDTITMFGNSKATVQEWADKLRKEAIRMNMEVTEAVYELTKRRF